MAITTLDQYLAATKQKVVLQKTTTRTTVAAQGFSLFDIAGNPGAGTLAVGNTLNGIMPTDAIAGYPVINAFGGGATGYVTGAIFANSVASRLVVFDTLFSCGAYNFNDAITLASQPSYVSRLPGSSYIGTEIWVETVTACTGNLAVAVQYTDQDGNIGATTGAVGISAAPTLGRMFQLPLAAGDSGVQTIEIVTGSVATVGTFNVHVLRRLFQGRCSIANDGGDLNLIDIGMPQIYDTSALRYIVFTDSTSSGVPMVNIEVSNA